VVRSEEGQVSADYSARFSMSQRSHSRLICVVRTKEDSALMKII